MIHIDNPNMAAQAECLLSDVLSGKVKCFILAAVTSDDGIITINSGSEDDEQLRLIGNLQVSVIMGMVDAKIHQAKK